MDRAFQNQMHMDPHPHLYFGIACQDQRNRGLSFLAQMNKDPVCPNQIHRDLVCLNQRNKDHVFPDRKHKDLVFLIQRIKDFFYLIQNLNYFTTPFLHTIHLILSTLNHISKNLLLLIHSFFTFQLINR